MSNTAPEKPQSSTARTIAQANVEYWTYGELIETILHLHKQNEELRSHRQAGLDFIHAMKDKQREKAVEVSRTMDDYRLDDKDLDMKSLQYDGAGRAILLGGKAYLRGHGK